MDQDSSTGVQNTSPTADQDASREDQDTPRDQDTPGDQDASLTDPSTLATGQVTTPPTTTVTQVTPSNVDNILSTGLSVGVLFNPWCACTVRVTVLGLCSLIP